MSDTEFRLKTSEIAPLINVSKVTLGAWAKEGAPCELRDGARWWNLDALQKWCTENGKRKGAKKRSSHPEKTAPVTNKDGEPVDLKERRLYWQAYKDKLQALKFAGTLLDAGEVHAGRIARIQAVKQGLLTQPRTYSGQLFACATEDELREAWLRLNRELLRQFAGEDPKKPETGEDDE